MSMAEATIIRRINPVTGAVERPWQDRQGNYVLGDPCHGASLHHRDKAVLTTDYDEAVALVRAGHSIRMVSEGRPPSLIRSASLTLEEIEVDDPTAHIERRSTAPFPKKRVFDDLRRALVAHAAAIAYWGQDHAALTFLGLARGDSAEPYEDADPAQVDLERFAATRVIAISYDYAFQVGDPTLFGPEMWGDLESLMDSATPGTVVTPSPMRDPRSAIRITTETAFARWQFDIERATPLSVRQLALLAQMEEVAARNALSKEGISARGGITNEIARRWLAGRRGYVASRPECLPTMRAAQP